MIDILLNVVRPEAGRSYGVRKARYPAQTAHQAENINSIPFKRSRRDSQGYSRKEQVNPVV